MSSQFGDGIFTNYPWIEQGNQSQAIVITVDQYPNGFGRVVPADGPEVWTEPIGYACFEFTQQGINVYTPWFPITVPEMAVVAPATRNNVQDRLILRPIIGAVLSQRTVNII